MSAAQDSDDDTPQLSAHALQALQEFYAEQAAELGQGEATSDGKEMPREDWQLSQFWYSDETATMLANEALAQAGESGSIGCISCPTLYHRLRDLKPAEVNVHILEYDSRFEKFGNDFIFYDYNKPLELPKQMEHYYDVIVADPPFLSEECLTKTAITIKFLTKNKIILCTGAVMKDLAGRLLKVNECKYVPKHTKNLANEFSCYTNFEAKYLDNDSR